VQPVHLTPGVLVVEFRPRPDVLQAAVLVGVEQAVEVEARCPLVLCLKDRLGVVKADPPYVLGELTVGSCQILRGGAQLTVCQLISSINASLFIGVSSPRLWPVRLRHVRRSPLALVPGAPEHCPCLSFSLTSAGTPSRSRDSSVEPFQHLFTARDDALLRKLYHPCRLCEAPIQSEEFLVSRRTVGLSSHFFGQDFFGPAQSRVGSRETDGREG
jgi:hypothetical protein